MITKLVKIEGGKSVRWLCEIDGKSLELSTRELLSPSAIKRAYFEKSAELLPITAKTWRMALEAATRNLEVVVPESEPESADVVPLKRRRTR